MPELDEITLTLPPDRDFHRVAHLVLGGLAVRHELTIETLEDLQLALSTVLEHAPPSRDVTVTLTMHDGTLEASVGPVDVAGALDAGDEDSLSTRRILWTVVDEVKLDGNYVRLLKRIDRP